MSLSDWDQPLQEIADKLPAVFHCRVIDGPFLFACICAQWLISKVHNTRGSVAAVVVGFALHPKLLIWEAVLVLSMQLLHLLYLAMIGRHMLNFRESKPKEIQVLLPDTARPNWKGEKLEKPSIKEPGLSGIQCYDPATSQKLGNIQPVSVNGIDRSIAAAKEAQLVWASTSFEQRRAVLRTLLKFILEHQEDIARVGSRDSGKPMLDSSFGDILVSVEKLQWTIRHGEKALLSSNRPVSLLMSYKKATVHYEPLGVVAALVSWNYPFHNFIGPIISALFTGNAIVVKPSERTAWSSQYFLQIVRAALRAHGHSEFLVDSLPMWPEIADYLTSHPDIQHITFIGSQSVCREVLKSSAKAIIQVCAELGGKDPAIILDDVPNSRFDAMTQILLRGTFQAAGQNCIGIERIIALPKVYDRLVAALEPKIKGLRMGAPLNQDNIDIGAMISPVTFDKLESLIQDAVAHGARLLTGGKPWINPEFPKGHYFEPTLLVEVTPDMKIAQEELFAPICVLMKASTVDEAIAIANSTSYSLGASVHGSSSTDIQKVVRGVRAGMVAVNDFASFYAVQLPFGGVAGSGYGRFAGEEGLRSLCNIKAVCEDRFWGVKTAIPPPHQYPVKNIQKAWTAAAGVVYLGYGGLRQKVVGLWDILRSL